jgi:hypothetical protein
VYAFSKPLWDGKRFVIGAVPDGKSPTPSGTLYTFDATLPLVWAEKANPEGVSVWLIREGEALGSDRARNLVTSSDLTTWKTVGKVTETTRSGIAFGNGVYVAPTGTGSPAGNTIGAVWSKDLTTWSQTSLSSMPDMGNVPTIGNIEFAQGSFVTPIRTSASAIVPWIATSADGQAFTRVSLPAGTATLTWVRFLADRWFTGGEKGALLSSASPSSWTPESTGVSVVLNDAAAGNGVVVLVGDSGTILHRPL